MVTEGIRRYCLLVTVPPGSGGCPSESVYGVMHHATSSVREPGVLRRTLVTSDCACGKCAALSTYWLIH